MPFNIPSGYSKLKTFMNGGSVVPNDLNLALNDIGNEVYTHKVDIADIEGVLSTYIKLASPANRRIAFGQITFGSGMGGFNQHSYDIPHGLGSTPLFAVVAPSLIGSAGTSTGLDESVTFGVRAVDSTKITVWAVLSNHATASVGPAPAFWLAISS